MRSASKVRTLIDHEYRARVRLLPCVVAVALGRVSECLFRVQACHLNHSGMGGKDVPDHGNLWPGCVWHHEEYHKIWRDAFEAKYGIGSLKVICLRIQDQIENGVDFPDEPYGVEVAHL